MATSGQVLGTNRPLSGYDSRSYVNWSLTSQSIANNTSTISWQAGWYFELNDRALSDATLDIDGSRRWTDASTFYSYTANFTTRYQQEASGSYTIAHDADGDKTFDIDISIEGFSAQVSAGSNSFALPTIPRYADIDSFTIGPKTDNSLTFNIEVSDTCDQFEYSTNNGSSYTTVSGDFTSTSYEVTGLSAGTSYTCLVRVRRKDSQLKTTSSSVTNSTYTYVAEFNYANTNPYADGALYRDTGSGYSAVASGDLYFTTYSAEGATTVPHLSEDPSDIMRAIIDFYNANGGNVTYDGTSIDDTGTSVSYTFKATTCYNAIRKTLELAPEGWYWYIDSATNLFHFHQKATSADHTLTLGKDIDSVHFDKRSEDIVNTVYFTGGGDPVLYKKYENSTSIGRYGVRAISIVDGRVTTASTAETMANRVLNTYASPEVRLKVTVSSDTSVGNGYDIESIRVGDTIRVANDTQSTGSSLWNVMKWNQDKWNYDITQLGTLVLQVVRIIYRPDSLTFTCSSIPPQVTKRIEDVDRNLNASLTVDNPDTPT